MLGDRKEEVVFQCSTRIGGLNASLLKDKKKTALVKVEDSRPVRSAGRVKINCFNTIENFCICYEGSTLSCKQVIKIHPVLLADEFLISKNTQNANFTKIWLKQAF